MDCADYRELVAADADGQLDAEQAAVARVHVAGCARCAVLRQGQQVIAALLRGRRAAPATPDAVRARIEATLAREAETPSVRVPRRRLLVGGAIAAALMLGFVVPRWWPRGPDLFDVLVRDAHAATADEVQFMPADSVESLRHFYRTSGRLGFQNVIVDLTALGFRVIGGAVVPIGDVAATFTVYESPHGKMICRRFAVGDIELPSGGEPFGDARLFTVDGVTIRIVRDGDAICCFASDIPHDILMAYLDRARHH